MKKLSLAFSAIMLFALCSCNYSLMSVEESGKAFISHSYSLLDGEKNYSMTVDEDSVVTIESVINEGTLSINVKKGRYKIMLNADHASGNYKITWKPQ